MKITTTRASREVGMLIQKHHLNRRLAKFNEQHSRIYILSR